MTDTAQIDAMTVELGSLDEMILAVVRTDDTKWVIQFDQISFRRSKRDLTQYGFHRRRGITRALK